MILVDRNYIMIKKSRCFRVAAFLVMRVATVAAIGALLAACADQGSVYRWTGETMGTYYRITLVTDSKIENKVVEGLRKGVRRELDAINNTMSTYRPDSELSHWNSLPQGDCLELGASLGDVVSRALQVSANSEGFFNPLVGSLVNRWGFGPDEKMGIPTSEELLPLIQSSRPGNISFDEQENRLCKSKLDRADIQIELDLSAIAKGYAVDRVAEYLRVQGFENYLVDVGGELWAEGHNPQGSDWRLAIEKPESELQTVHRTIALTNAAIATSGDYRNYYEHEGRRYSHTIDPHTGYPVTHSLASVTVVADSVAKADAWATAILSAGPEKGREWAEKYGLAVYLIQRENSTYTNWASEPFKHYMN